MYKDKLTVTNDVDEWFQDRHNGATHRTWRGFGQFHELILKSAIRNIETAT